MIGQITEFYIDRALDRVHLVGDPQVVGDIQNSLRRNHFITRVEFLYGAAAAVCYLIKACVCTLLFAIATLATLFQNEYCKERLFGNASLVPMYLSAIPIGLAGAVFPNMINAQFRGAPS